MNIIRWILSPLGAIVALIVVRFILRLMTIIGPDYGVIVYIWNNVVSEGVAAAACVLAGAAIAPTYNKRLVSIIYATIFCCLCVVSLILAITQSYTFGQYLPIIVSFIGAIAGVEVSEVLDDF